MQVNIVKLYNSVPFRSFTDTTEDKPTVSNPVKNDPAPVFLSPSEHLHRAYNDPKLVKKITYKDFESLDTWENYKRTLLPTAIRRIKKNCYRGETLLYTPRRLPPLKSKGVTTVIDLANIPDYDILCNLKGFQYYTFPIFLDYEKKPPFITRQEFAQTHKIPNTHLPDDSEEFAYDNEAREFINSFKDFVSVVNKGHFYICCKYGKLRTNTALLMNQYFNPEWDAHTALQADDEQIEKFKNFYENLSIRGKRDLGFTREFEEKLRKKLGITK